MIQFMLNWVLTQSVLSQDGIAVHNFKAYVFMILGKSYDCLN